VTAVSTGPLPESPAVDDRGYPELLAEALARIPVHNPEWTNRNESDPGVTLLQLWAFMAESIVYRSALIPERNRQAFLRLIGYQRAPAQAASGLVAFEHRSGPLTSRVLEPGMEVAAGSVPFRTDTGLEVLPVTGKAFLKRLAVISDEERADVEREYGALFASFAEPGTDFAVYAPSAVDWAVAGHEPVDLATTVDGALWLALLARPGDPVDAAREALAHRILTLGVVPELAADGRVLPPSGARSRTGSGIEVSLPNVAVPLPEEAAGRIATYVPVPSRAAADVLSTAAVVQLELPGPDALATWALDPTEDGVGAFPPALEGAEAERLVTWLRVRPAPHASTGSAGPDDDGPAAQATARLRWLGVNAALVRQRAHVAAETLGRGSGQGDQVVELTQVPVLTESLVLSVAGHPWQRIDDLACAASEAPLVQGSSPVLADPVERVDVYTVDRQSGEIRFGDGIHGRRPPAGAVISATYDHGGGRAGLVAAGAINKGPTVPAGVTVHNPVPTWGGAEAESVADAELQVSGFVRNRDRGVTAGDYADIVRRTPGIDLGRVEILPLYDPGLGDVASPGVVTVLVVPRYDARRPETPVPDRQFLDAVCAHLDPRRLVTTRVHVHGPEYVPVWLSVGMTPVPGQDVAVVRQALGAGLRTFLSPLVGGRAEIGWPLGTDLERLEAWTVAARVEGVAKVTGVLLCGSDGADVDRVALTGLRLPRLVAVSVRSGPPQPLAELLGAAPPLDLPVLPIPYVPAEC
jgi:predicted phage baseplate assembly protein